MSIFTTSGYHYISNKKGDRFYPIIVGFNVCSNQTVRHTLALKNLPVEKSINGCIDTWNIEIEDLREENEGICESLTEACLSQFFEDQQTFKLRVWTPKARLSGKTVEGICVGGHIDYRTAITPKGKSYGKPHMLWQLAFIGESNKVTFVTAKREEMNPTLSLQQNINESYNRMCDAYPAGGSVVCRVVPKHKKFRLALESFTAPQGFIDIMLDGIVDELCPQQPKKSNNPPLSSEELVKALKKISWVDEISVR